MNQTVRPGRSAEVDAAAERPERVTTEVGRDGRPRRRVSAQPAWGAEIPLLSPPSTGSWTAVV